MMKRNTIQCSLVLEAVRKLQCHATADEIYEAIVRDHPTISRGTVYRNLQRLTEMDQIRKREVPGGADRYDHLCHDHYHLKCTRCGRLFDVDMEYMTDLENSIKNTRGFQFTGHDIIFRGICPECQQ
ncbi:MAG: transcriptional repressor [Lachnospiraceae bacterium]|nr:transcriptional repressor [Lachnospiraceae bacterium]